MENNFNIIKKIYELKDYNFIIPSYQRGYRWGTSEAIKLLDDIIQNKEKSYFIQPIVYRKNEEKSEYIIVDGQQRLTTIFIFLSIINNNKPIYNLNYESKGRQESGNFLNNIKENKDETIDIFHMSNIYDKIKERLRNETDKEREKINLSIRNTKFIFYEVSENDEKDFFKRINMGKIYLTNGELIRALLLDREAYENDENKKIEQLKWAVLLDNMERNLHNEDFWCMLNNDLDKYPNTRIDLIMEISARRFKKEKEKENEKENGKENEKLSKYWIFDIFEEYKKESNIDSITEIWECIFKNYKTLYSWFNDDEIYHLIGYIINFEKKSTIDKLIELLDKYDSSDITDRISFIRYLNENIKKDILKIKPKLLKDKESIVNDEDSEDSEEIKKVKKIIESLNYNMDEGEAIKKILLLFNILTIEKNNQKAKEEENENEQEIKRFSFGCYKNQEWNIEHIHAINEENSKNEISEKYIESFKNVISKEYQDMLKKEINDNKNNNTIAFNKVYKKMLNEQKEMTDEDQINSLRNLALLDKNTNDTYKDDIFIIKRDYIINNDKKGKFIPICTRNAFLKYYSKNIQQVVCWSEEDGNDYLKEIKKVLSSYFKEEHIK